MSGKGWQGKERRASPRVSVSVKVELAQRGKADADFYFTRDVSSTGLFLLCKELPAVDSMLKITIALPGVRQLIPVNGKVVRQVTEGEHRGVGVQFIDVPTEFRFLLEEQIARIAQQNPA